MISSPPPAAILDVLPVAVGCLDSNGRLLDMNSAWRKLFASTAPPQLGGDYVAFCEGAQVDGLPGFRDLAFGMRAVLATGHGHFEDEYGCTVDGTKRWFRFEVSALPGGGAVVAHIDITRHREAVERAEHEASTDELTGLLSRRAIERAITRATGCCDTVGGALLLIDLDGFKRINDRFGHETGDRVLKAIAHRISRALRPEDLVGRLGGDEFLVLVRGIRGEDRLITLIDRVRSAIEQPIGDADGLEIGASIGGVVLRGGDVEGIDVVAAADARMYQDKRTRSRVATLSTTPGVRRDYERSLAP